MRRRTAAEYFLALSSLVLAFSAFPILAQDDAEEGPGISWTQGPFVAVLGDNLAEVKVAEGFVFANAEETQAALRAWGNPTSGDELGMISPASDDEDWVLIFEWSAVGYVKDEDKDEIDATKILKGISKGTEAANSERKKMGAAPLHVKGWIQEPRYDEQTHNLEWALEAEEEGSGNRVANYNVRLLGRKGYMSATLIEDPAKLEQTIPAAEAVLGGFHFQDGQRYADFRSGDKVAKYGLVALVAGGAGAAAMKLGLFAALGKFFAKAWKLVVVGVAALGAGIKKLFGGRKAPSFDQP